VRDLRFINQIRNLHYWGAGLIALPSFLILVTGFLLIIKNQVPLINPETKKVKILPTNTSIAQIIEVAKSCSTEPIKTIDIRPEKNLTRVRFADHTEAQLDLENKQVIHCQKRYVSLLISLHEGSFFTDYYKYLIALPTILILLFLWASGVYLFLKIKRKLL
jgi:hypothetical protein